MSEHPNADGVGCGRNGLTTVSTLELAGRKSLMLLSGRAYPELADEIAPVPRRHGHPDDRLRLRQRRDVHPARRVGARHRRLRHPVLHRRRSTTG